MQTSLWPEFYACARVSMAESTLVQSVVVALSLLLFVPLSLVLKYWIGASELWVFASATLAIAILADWVRRSTEQLAGRTGPAIGGLLNISFGSAAELILALFVLATGNTTVVRAQITGSIIGTSLFGLGLAIIVGGWGRGKQTFQRDRAGLLSTLLILSIIALLLPAVFDYQARLLVHVPIPPFGDEELSLSVSVVLLLLYAANLIYTLVTRRDAFESEEGQGEVSRSLPWALAVLVGSTAVIGVRCETRPLRGQKGLAKMCHF